MKEILFAVFLVFLNIQNGYCGDVTVGFSPPSIRFGSASALYASNLDDVLSAALGYTPQSFSWKGLTVTSAFHYPSAAVVFGVSGAGAAVKMEGTSYELKEDFSLSDIYSTLSARIGNHAQRPVHFQHFTSNELKKDISFTTLPEFEKLQKDDSVDGAFLKQMANLPSIMDSFEEESSLEHGGQDIIFVDIDSFAAVVRKYGIQSEQVKEAAKILRSAIVQTMARVREFYADRVVIMSAMFNKEFDQIRRKRAIVKDEEETEVDINLAPVYSDDFPVIFNIVLILSVILIAALIAISVSMAFMDPGRDSIIYRMTNPRMKKDQ